MKREWKWELESICVCEIVRMSMCVCECECVCANASYDIFMQRFGFMELAQFSWAANLDLSEIEVSLRSKISIIINKQFSFLFSDPLFNQEGALTVNLYFL